MNKNHCFSISAIFAAVFCWQCNKQRNTDLAFLYQTYDFKSAKKGTLVKTAFPFKNNTDDTITVESISVECDCVYPGNSMPQKVAPDAMDTILVNYNTMAVNKGHQGKMISIRTNGTPRIYQLKIVGDIF